MILFQPDRIARIIGNVASLTGESTFAIRGAAQTHPLVWYRHLAMLAVREATGASLPVIGREFGSRHHTTVLHGIRRAQALVATDPEAKAVVDLAKEVGRG